MRLLSLDEELKRLERVFRMVQDEHRVIRRTRNRLLNSKALIHCLPNEILAIIFKATIQYHPKLMGDIIPIAAVCSYWRDLALSIPSLWSFIKIYIRWNQDSASSEYLRTFTARAKKAPLRLLFTLDHRFRGRMGDAMDQFSSYFPRCDTMVFYVTDPFVLKVKHDFSALRILVVGHVHKEGDRSIQPVAPGINFPLLEGLHLSNRGISLIHWILPNLRHLCLSEITPLLTCPPPLPRLQSLSLGFEGTVVGKHFEFLDFLDKHPSVSSLQIHGDAFTIGVVKSLTPTSSPWAAARGSLAIPCLSFLIIRADYYSSALKSALKSFLLEREVEDHHRMRLVCDGSYSDELSTSWKATQVSHEHISEEEFMYTTLDF